MLGYDVLHNGQPQAGSAALLGTALIHPVEPFKYTLLMLPGDSDSGVLYR